MANVNVLGLEPASFDRILSIDTLHLAADVRRTLVDLEGALTAGGTLGVFWETWIGPSRPREMLSASGNRFARTLAELRWRYETVDFSDANAGLWERMRRALDQMRTDFEREGNRLLWESLVSQTERMDWGTGSRYLYRIPKPQSA